MPKIHKARSVAQLRLVVVSGVLVGVPLVGQEEGHGDMRTLGLISALVCRFIGKCPKITDY